MDAGLAALSLLGLLLALALIAWARNASIRRQIFAAVATISLALTIVFGLVVVSRLRARAVAFAHRAALDDAKVVSDLTARSMEVLGLSIVEGAQVLRQERILYGFTESPGDTRVQLLDLRGRVIFDTLRGRTERRDLAAEPDVRAALSGRTDATPLEIEPGLVAASVPVRAQGQIVGVARVEKPALAMTRLADDLLPELIVLALLCAIAAALAALWIGRGLARPLERLTAAARAIASGERQARLPVPRGREVGSLTNAFETMRNALEERDTIEALAADLSHELKNPIAAIRAAAELIEDAAREDPEAAQRFARSIGESAIRLEAITRDLLALATLEAKGVDRADVDLEEAARAATRALASRAEQRGVEVVITAQGQASADPVWLGRALENLLANAIDFSPEGARVELRTESSASEIVILVEDRGGGIAPEVRERLFTRFATSRGSDGGTGLGLALVRSVAEAHGGRAELRASSASGSTFAIVLPRS